MDPIMDVIKNSEEPEWLEKIIIGELRLWQVMFLSLIGIILIIVVACCCFRFRIPRTKQQIEADYRRRMITTKFRLQLETIEDSKMDAMSLNNALELLYEKSQAMEGNNQQGSQASSIMSPQQSSLEASLQPEGGQKPEPGSGSGMNFVKFATKVAHLSKLQPKSPTSPPPSGTRMDF